MKFKSHISSQVERAKKELSLFEYILWWIMRGMMVVAIICTVKTRDTAVWLKISGNLVLMFIIPMIAFIFPSKTFLGRIPFRVQTCIDLFIIESSFFGHFINLYRYEGRFDKILHIVSGFVTVFIGYELIKILEPEKPLTKKRGIFGGFMFSYFIMIMWEIFEFFSDFILNSNNQAYTKAFCENVYTDSYFFIKIFGRGNAGEEQLPVFDTMIDILAAVVGSFIALAVMMIFIKEKKTENTE
ncbi:MAG: hypothetical protein ACI4VI_02120, partial [Acutalibacteraceae bacterium]